MTNKYDKILDAYREEDSPSSVVNSFNGLTGAVILAAGTNIVLTPVGNTITITAQNDATAVWGAITGTLSDQTDLQAALDAAGADPESKTISRNADGFITSIAGATKTITLTRDASNFVTSKTDSTNTWTYTRNGSNQITSVSVT